MIEQDQDAFLCLLMTKILLKTFLILLLFHGMVDSYAAEVMVAVASNFTSPMKRIAESFGRETGHQVRLSFGSTGSFYAQIRNGAPYHILFSADDETPQKLVSDGLAIDKSQFTYAMGRLVLWSPNKGYFDNNGDILKTQSIKKIAVANPQLAPYGLAAVQVLNKLGLYSNLESKLITGENITQTYQFIASGAVDLGFIALSQIYQEGVLANGSAWIVPSSYHAPIQQDAVLLKNGQDNEAAKALLLYMRTQKIKSLIKSYGYDI